MAPERTIQGQALRELVELPQVVGGLDDDEPGAPAWTSSAASPTQVVPVSSLEAAELVKLSNNCHTDLIYAFGNEIALHRRAARPRSARGHPGGQPRLPASRPVQARLRRRRVPVQGPVHHDRQRRRHGEPFLVGQARELNEYLPVHVAERVVEMICEARGDDRGRPAGGARLGVQGLAAHRRHARHPDRRDDAGVHRRRASPCSATTRWSPTEVIRQYGGEPVSLDKAFTDSRRGAGHQRPPRLPRRSRSTRCSARRHPKLIYDSWRILDEAAVTAAGVRYAGLGLPSRVRRCVA